MISVTQGDQRVDYTMVPHQIFGGSGENKTADIADNTDATVGGRSAKRTYLSLRKRMAIPIPVPTNSHASGSGTTLITILSN
jgi:hypothetical protein